MAAVEERLLDAARGGRVADVVSLLRNNPGLDVNCADNRKRTALHFASLSDHVEVVKLLLAQPRIRVNLKNAGEKTPFFLACEYHMMSVVKLLSKDPRISVTLDSDGRTPLWRASYIGWHEVVEWLIASGRDLGDVSNTKGRTWNGKKLTALEIAKEEGKSRVVTLLERFLANPEEIRHELRVKLGVLDELAAEVFALTIFLCDDLLQLNPALASSASDPDDIHFFAISKRLPMELQMVLCYRVAGSMKQNILRKDSEPAFKSLARALLLAPSTKR